MRFVNFRVEMDLISGLLASEPCKLTTTPSNSRHGCKAKVPGIKSLSPQSFHKSYYMIKISLSNYMVKKCVISLLVQKKKIRQNICRFNMTVKNQKLVLQSDLSIFNEKYNLL